MLLIQKKPVEAKLVGSTLVAVFRNSEPNLIWKFDLERNHSFTLALQGEEGDLELGVTSPKGDFYPVARFTGREDAEEAFNAVQKVLMKRKTSFFQRFLFWIFAFILLILFIIFFGRYLWNVGSSSYTTYTKSPATQPIEIPSGVPVPADQVLRPPP